MGSEMCIRDSHKPFPYTKVSKLVKNGVIVSDNPMDYLLLYRNASEVYSDRVHACIPTLAFGNKARLFSNSPRIALFENAKIPDVREKTCQHRRIKRNAGQTNCISSFIITVIKRMVI